MVRVSSHAVPSLIPHSGMVLAEDRSVRRMIFVVPGTSADHRCGGLLAEFNTYQLASDLFDAELVTYADREEGFRFLDDVLMEGSDRDSIFVVSWGPHVKSLLKLLSGRNVVYHAHSAGYSFELPTNVPIMAVSKNTMSIWGQKSPHSLIYYLPNQISDEFRDMGVERDIEVLVQARKSSRYLLDELVPALREHCKVYVAEGHVEDLPMLFNRSKVYLYDSAEFWHVRGLTEGFGLPPLEAMACGCHVFSSTNGGLADYLDPGFNAGKIASYSVEFDVRRIVAAVTSGEAARVPHEILRQHRPETLRHRLDVIVREINYFFDEFAGKTAVIPEVRSRDLWEFKLRRLANAVKRALHHTQPAWA